MSVPLPLPPSGVDDAAIRNLLRFFPKYRIGQTTPELETVTVLCRALFERDNDTGVVHNPRGALCEHYPEEIIIVEAARGPFAAEGRVNDAAELESAMQGDVTYARCRRRFAVPVILYDKMNICRSATLARGSEIYYRNTVPSLTARIYQSRRDPSVQASKEKVDGIVADSVYEAAAGDATSTEMSDSMVARCRTADIALLRLLGVRFISDLMIEKRKLKYGVYVSSSEKADNRDRYANFDLAVMPFPGVEWFNSVRSGDASAVYFDWTHSEVTAEFRVSQEHLDATLHLGIDWKMHKDWDLITLTQHYLLLLTDYIKRNHGNENSGLLVHCISGWDRTPLFVSLLRLSLWADGVIHQSLSAKEMLYLTVGYDWLLFGHLLNSRLAKGEEIFLFCFDFLMHIVDSKFSVGSGDGHLPPVSEDDLKTPVAERSPQLPTSSNEHTPGVQSPRSPSPEALPTDGLAAHQHTGPSPGDVLANGNGMDHAHAEGADTRRTGSDTDEPHDSDSDGGAVLVSDEAGESDTGVLVDDGDVIFEGDSPGGAGQGTGEGSGSGSGLYSQSAPIAMPRARYTRRSSGPEDDFAPSSVESCGSVKNPPPLNLGASVPESEFPATRRAQRLLAVRAAFVPLYKEVVPTAVTAGGDTWLGWLGHLVKW